MTTRIRALIAVVSLIALGACSDANPSTTPPPVTATPVTPVTPDAHGLFQTYVAIGTSNTYGWCKASRFSPTKRAVAHSGKCLPFVCVE